MPLKEQDFVKKEAEKLNKELEKLLEETRARERYSLSIIADITAWVFLKDNPSEKTWKEVVSCIPFVTAVLFGLSTFLLYRNMKWIVDYLLQIEKYFLPGNPSNFGWEKSFNSRNRKSWFVGLTYFMWGLQIAMPAALAIYVCFCMPVPVALEK